MTPEDLKALAADLVRPLNAETIFHVPAALSVLPMGVTVSTVHAPTRLTADATIPVAHLAKTLARGGYWLTTNDRGDLHIERIPGYVSPEDQAVRKVDRNDAWLNEQQLIQEGGATESAEVTEERSRD